MLFFRRKQNPDQTDEELLELYISTGRTEYFGELYNRYVPLLYGLCMKYLQDVVKVEDAVMQLFENLLPKMENYRVEVFRNWIYTTAKNHCLQQLRQEEKMIPVDFGARVMEFDPVLHLLDEEETDKEENLKILNDCIEKLPDPQRVSIVRFFLKEESYAEVAEHTGYQLKSVKSYIQNGKRNLRICMESREIQ